MKSEMSLEDLRREIDRVDDELMALLNVRADLVHEIGEIKNELGLPVLDPAREAAVVRRAAALARDHDLDEELIRDVIWRIIASARGEQGGFG